MAGFDAGAPRPGYARQQATLQRAPPAALQGCGSKLSLAEGVSLSGGSSIALQERRLGSQF
jgi:hypothetical protein